MRKFGKNVFIAQGAAVVGNVVLGDDTSVWYNAVLRGDSNQITIGKQCNVQDCCVIHANEKEPVVLGDRVSMGHNSIVHSAKIGNDVLVGMGAIVMDGAEIGENCLIAAGALVTKGTKIPPNSLVMGMPAKVKREMTPEELEVVHHNAKIYMAFRDKNLDQNWDRSIVEYIDDLDR